jgi:dTDP-3,4-didehydro-2,6-dideoxy-alpha-D-glucose 3-reductase
VSRVPVLRLGVLGTSDIARRRVLPAALASPWTTVTALASRDPRRAAADARRFGARACRDYDAVLAAPDVDGVYVPLPCELHDEWAVRALEAGKHVLVEKPLAPTGPRARALVDTARERGLVLRENIMFLHHPQHAAVRALVRDGRIGSPRTFSAAFAIPPVPENDIRRDPTLAGGALRDVGLYPLRAARYFLGAGLRVAGATLRRAPGAVDVAGQVLLAAPSGVLADLTFGFEHAYAGSYRLWGSSGRVALDRAWTPPASHRPLVRLDEQDHAEEMVLPAADQVATCLEEFASSAIDCGAGGGEPCPDVDPAVGAEVAELIDEIERVALEVPLAPSRTGTGLVGAR